MLLITLAYRYAPIYMCICNLFEDKLFTLETYVLLDVLWFVFNIKWIFKTEKSKYNTQ